MSPDSRPAELAAPALPPRSIGAAVEAPPAATSPAAGESVRASGSLDLAEVIEMMSSHGLAAWFDQGRVVVWRPGDGAEASVADGFDFKGRAADALASAVLDVFARRTLGTSRTPDA